MIKSHINAFKSRINKKRSLQSEVKMFVNYSNNFHNSFNTLKLVKRRKKKREKNKLISYGIKMKVDEYISSLNITMCTKKRVTCESL